MELLIQELYPHLFQRRANGKDLRDDLGALSLSLDHALQAANLPLDPLEPVQNLLVCRTSYRFDRGLLRRVHLSFGVRCRCPALLCQLTSQIYRSQGHSKVPGTYSALKGKRALSEHVLDKPGQV